MKGLPKHHLLKLLDLSAELAADSRLLRWILTLLFRIRVMLLRVSQFGLSPYMAAAAGLHKLSGA